VIDQKFIYKIHKWLGLVAAVTALAWFVSGALMAVPARFLTLTPTIVTNSAAEARLPGAPEFDDARVSAADAIAAVRAHIGKPFRVVAVSLRRLPGRVAYEIATDTRGRRLVDAVDGRVFQVDETLARQVVARFRGTDAGLGAVSRETGPIPRLGGPGFRVPVDGAKGTTFYVSAHTAEVRLTDRLSRPVAVITRLHSLSFLRPVMPNGAVRLVMIFMSATGTLVAVSGVLILIVQLRRWFQRRPSLV